MIVIKINYSSVSPVVNVNYDESPIYVRVMYGGAGDSITEWGEIIGTLSNQTDLQNALNAKVPYSGATANVDLGEYELKAGQIELDQSPTGVAGVAVTRWNDTIGSTETTLKGGSVILKNGVDLVARVVNKVSPNTTLTKAAYQAVRISGAQGQRLAVAFAQANNDNNSADTIGLVTETIATNQEGFIMTVGSLEGINTTGTLQGETWSDGDVLYLSPTVAGAITNVKPVAPQHLVVIGYVEYAHQNNGKIYVKVMNGWELGELHDVNTNGATNGQVLTYNGSIWVPSTNGVGTVTSVDMTVPTGLTVSGNPITSSGILALGLASGYSIPTDANQTNWTAAYNDKINSAAVTGTTTKTLTLNQQDGGTITASWTDYDTAPVTSVFGRTGAVVATSGDYTTDQVTEGTNLYFTDARARAAISLTTTGTSGAATYIGGVLNIPQYQAALTNPITGTGTAGQVAYWSGTNTQTGSNNLFWDNANGRLGIGTNTPATTLSINSAGIGIISTAQSNEFRKNTDGSINQIRLLSVNDSYASQWAIGNGVNNLHFAISRFSVSWTTYAQMFTNGNLLLQNGGTFTDGGQRLQVNGSARIGSTTASAMYWDDTNNRLGIGTASPAYNLHLVSSSTSVAAFRNSAAAIGQILVGNTVSDLAIRILASGDSLIFSDTGKYLAFGSNGASERMRITSGGNVGINNTNPGDYSADADNLVVGTTSGNNGITISAATTGYSCLFMADGTTGTDRYRGYLQYNHNSDALEIGTSGAERIRITSGGNLLVGTTTDSGEKLQVNGRVKSSDFASNNGTVETRLSWSSTPAGVVGTISNHPLEFYTNSSSKMTLSASGNLGIGVSPSAWGIIFKVIEGIGATSLGFRSNAIELINNAFYDGTNWIYKNNGLVNRYNITNGQYIWYTAPSGIAGNSITFTQAMTFASTGNLLIGTTTDGGQKLQVSGTGYFSDSLGIGTTNLTGFSLNVSKNVTGATTCYGISHGGVVQSDVTNAFNGYLSNATTAAATFTLTTYRHFYANQGTIGANSAITNQIGYFVESNLTGATNNYGFYGNIASGSNRWNIYMPGTANNYMAGNLGIGTTTTNSFLNIAAGTTAKAQINLAASTAPTTPNNGDIWFDGTDIKIRVGGVTKTFTLV